jgi:hypothetical protein
MFNLLINQLITELSDIEKGLRKAQEKKKVIIAESLTGLKVM